MFLNIVIFILILGLLILVHELGHFVMAKRAGVKVEEFGLGFPPRIFGVKKGETIYSLNFIPLGGFVRIYGENGPGEGIEKLEEEDRAFYKKPIGKRAKILVAGVTMNLILAAVLLGFGHWIGLPSIIDDTEVNNLRNTEVQITQIDFESPASYAGINIGDVIKELRFNNEIVAPIKVIEVQDFIKNHLGEEIIVVIQRGNNVLNKEVVLRDEMLEEKGALGVGLARTAIISYPWYKSFIMGITSVISMAWFIMITLVGIFWRLFSVGEMAVELSGPVGIFNLTGQATQLGFIYILQLAALLSINLAIINIFPFPALDGGRLLFLAIEKIKGSPVSRKVEGIIHMVGFVVLILLLVAITWRDVARLF
ncbi:RIP metalloprotease RseP [Patescibacteria group bacterium]